MTVVATTDWLISGGGASVAIPWDGRIGAGRDDHIVASGNIRGADYRAMFGMDNHPPEVPLVNEEIMSYLMIAVPEVDTAAADFTITVTGRSPGAGEDVTPDIDVIGVLPPRPSPARDGQPAVDELQDAVSGDRGVEMLTLDHELKTRSGLHLASATALARRPSRRLIAAACSFAPYPLLA